MATKKKTTRKQSAKALAIAPTVKEREERIKRLISHSNKVYGKGSLSTVRGKNALNAEDEVQEVVPTGCIRLDLALGIKGLPSGRIVEIFGAEASGKTTLTLQIIAEAQRLGLICAFIDAEHALNPSYASGLGVNLNELLISQPMSGEQAMDQLADLSASPDCDVVVIDSVSALVPQAEIDGDMKDHHPGAQARLMSKALRVIKGEASKTNTLVIFINQTRMKIGVMFGSPKTTSGGKALRYYASVRIEVAVIKALTHAGERYGNRVKMTVVKNRFAPPFRACEVDLVYGQGISAPHEAKDIGVELGIIEKNGSWYSYKGDQIGQGSVRVTEWLVDHPEVIQTIRDQALGIINAEAS